MRRAIGVLAAAQRSYSGCLQYRENVRDARVAVAARGQRPIDVVYVGDWHEHPGFIEANADHIRQAAARLPEDVRDSARLIFTAHSIPTAMAATYPYEANLLASAKRIALASGRTDWELVFQSRSGRPGDPWLEPDICDYLRRAPHRVGDPLPRRLSVRSRRGALRSRRRSGGRLPGTWYRDGSRGGGERASALHRGAGRRGPRNLRPLRSGNAATAVPGVEASPTEGERAREGIGRDAPLRSELLKS